MRYLEEGTLEFHKAWFNNTPSLDVGAQLKDWPAFFNKLPLQAQPKFDWIRCIPDIDQRWYYLMNCGCDGFGAIVVLHMLMQNVNPSTHENHLRNVAQSIFLLNLNMESMVRSFKCRTERRLVKEVELFKTNTEQRAVILPSPSGSRLGRAVGGSSIPTLDNAAGPSALAPAHNWEGHHDNRSKRTPSELRSYNDDHDRAPTVDSARHPPATPPSSASGERHANTLKRSLDEDADEDVEDERKDTDVDVEDERKDADAEGDAEDAKDDAEDDEDDDAESKSSEVTKIEKTSSPGRKTKNTKGKGKSPARVRTPSPTKTKGVDIEKANRELQSLINLWARDPTSLEAKITELYTIFRKLYIKVSCSLQELHRKSF